ncbi:radical SAM protein [Infirmifilum lucidum]|uniref:Radical SAM protein n=1 Tax=Infirmifilum lucidum TaxID=2776706 RepID=A0A7L9FH64_9CREN|nr:PqqD family peptide modification chaperone [Infirmifilum lucidum]QOJ79099.1 radical SAM protein [Infirmifilum lucidum]
MPIELSKRYYPFFSNARTENTYIRGRLVKSIILVPPLDKVVFLNETATEILVLLGKGLTPLEIVEELSHLYGADRGEVERDVTSFIESGLREGFIREEGSRRVPLDKLENSMQLTQGYLKFPVDVDVEVTRRCNMRCVHCYSNAMPSGEQGPPLEFFETLADELGEGSAMRVLLGGGEPLLRDDIVEIVEAFTSRGLAVHMSTNGLLFDEEIAEELYRAGLRVIQFSLDGIGEIHDTLRGFPGAFDRVVGAIKTAKSLGFTVLVKSVVMRANVHEISKVYELISKLGVDFYSFNRAVPAGRARPNWSKVYVLYSEYEKVLGSVKEALGGSRMEAGFEERLLHVAKPSVAEPPSTCNAGISYISIDANLRVRPCSYFPERFTCGGLYRDWESLKEAWNGCGLLRELRGLSFEKLEEPCRSCRRCYGGCRAAALLLYNRVTAPDPLCPLVERLGGLNAGGRESN